MIDGVLVKVCGLTSLVDAEWADKIGADYLGFIFHPGSPRRIDLAHYRAMAPRLPPRRKVAVSVEPSREDLARQREEGFDFFQIHFRPGEGESRLAEWAETVGHDRLWLAPKLPPGSAVATPWLAHAGTFLLDGYAPDKFGGTGRTGDWATYARSRTSHPNHTWILSGGLNPANIAEALSATAARFVDVNSGVESAPGVKDLEKLKAFVVALHRARAT
jgi:phosphoribosylanthranilate isomerase